MDMMEFKRNGVLLLILALPPVLSAMFAMTMDFSLLMAYIAFLLLNISLIPGFRKRENCSMYAMLAISSIPVNISLIIKSCNSDILQCISNGYRIIAVLLGVLLYGLLFSLEEIAMGVIVRIIWPYQPHADKSFENGEV